MEGRMLGFIVYCMIGMAFLCFAVYAWFSKKPKPVGFWANAELFEVTDIKKYNHAMSKLSGTFGVVLMVLGFPLLAGQNSAWAMLSVVGVMIESIAAMVVYVLVIEKKYRKSNTK